MRAGAAQPAALSGPLLPHKLLYAAALAEAGQVPRALAYIGAAQAGLAAFGAKLPPGLLLARAVAAELEERLRMHAAVRRSGFFPQVSERCTCAWGHQTMREGTAHA
jgi:hypothetical protein